jgi:predicted Zn-dependent protease
MGGAAGLLLSGCSENPATGRRQLTLVSEAQLAGLGEAAWRDALSSLPRSGDPALLRRLEDIGGRVIEAAGRAGEAWEFAVFDVDEVNAFVLPGGKVGFYRGLLDFARGDGEVAAVMGHEVGHVQARHAVERLSQQAAVELGVSLAASALSENYGANADEIAGALGMGLMYGVVLPYSRRHELEADALGLDLMEKAKFDPAEAVAFWERMVAETASSGRGAEWLSTHPADDRRLAALRAQIAPAA